MKKFFLVTLISISMLLAGCATTNTGELQASGIIEAQEVNLAPQVDGSIAEILVQEGEAVQAGQPLVRLENDLLMAQYQQAQAAVEAANAALEAARVNRDLAQSNQEAAQASLEAAQAGLEAAQAQLTLTLQTAHEAELLERADLWATAPDSNATLPTWYFTKDERLQAAQVELQAAQDALQAEQDNYQSVLDSVGAQDVKDAEERLNKAQAAFDVADALYQREINANNGKQDLSNTIQNLYDAAKSELEAARNNYQQVLTQKDRTDLLEARARLTTAQERVLLAQQRIDALQTGLLSPQVRAAQAAVAQAQAQVKLAEVNVQQAALGVKGAESAITQAEKALAQAEATRAALQVQVDRLTIHAPIDAVVLTVGVKAGELAQPGATLLTLAHLDALSVTVYIPENRYGEITLGQSATLTVDSFPDETFGATVTHIADKAEYTPRNVQTKEERVTTVYAVKLSLDNPDARLKPGMPVDVTFGP